MGEEVKFLLAGNGRYVFTTIIVVVLDIFLSLLDDKFTSTLLSQLFSLLLTFARIRRIRLCCVPF